MLSKNTIATNTLVKSEWLETLGKYLEYFINIKQGPFSVYMLYTAHSHKCTCTYTLRQIFIPLCQKFAKVLKDFVCF